ncbi:MAG: hypothetical protein AAFO81_07935 [Pseudomonadota bacterium]
MVSNTLHNTVSDAGQDNDQARRLALFSNRVALKKAYAALLKQQERDARVLQASDQDVQRLQTKLDYLENLLTEPDTAFSTLLFFRLRGLWRQCHRFLAARADTLSTRASGRRRVVAIESWQAKHRLHMKTLDDAIESERAHMQALKKRLRVLSNDIERAGSWWHWWRRRALQRQKSGLALELQSALIAHNDTMLEHRRSKRQRAPKGITLSVNDARQINLTLLATAQFMHDYFDERGLAEKARVAYHRDVGVVDFGDDRRCRELFSAADSAMAAFEQIAAAGDFDAKINKQVRRLAALARYDTEQSVIAEPFELPLDNVLRGEGGLTISNSFTCPKVICDEDTWTLSAVLVKP